MPAAFSEKPWGCPWPIMAAITLAQTGATLGALALPPLAPFFQAELSLSRAQVGVLMSALYLGAVAMSLPAGWLTDAVGVRRMLGAALALSGVFAAAISQAPYFSLMLLFAFLVGWGYGAINPATTRAVMDWFPAAIRATAMGIQQTGVTLGGALGAAIAPGLALLVGWRQALLFIGGLVAAGALLVLASYREAAPRGAEGRAAGRRAGGLGRVLRNRPILQLAAMGTLFAAVQVAAQTYMVLYLKEVILMPVVLAGGYLALAQMSGVVGRVGWGIGSDRLWGGRRKGVLALIGGLVWGLTLLLGLASPATPRWALAVLVGLFGLTAIGWSGVFMALISELSGREASGTATGLVLTVTFTGTIIGPPLFGHLADLTGSYRLSWHAAAAAVAAGAVLVALLREERAPT